jgi:glucose-6-phosphate dehydrogenase assembly protein OpcA
VVKHAESVVLPLLLPDSPVAIWWPTTAPADPAADPLGALAQRRITDSAAVSRGKATAMLTQCETYAPGNTDLSWTRLTPWRALLAAALDQHPLKVTGARVVAERVSPSADLLVAWLTDRLKVEVTRGSSEGPGITEVSMDTKEGAIRISRADGRLATFSSPNRPDRPVALKRREVPALLSEELRRLDEDDVYAQVAKRLVKLRSAR